MSAGQCDCCGRTGELSFSVAYGIETWSCADGCETATCTDCGITFDAEPEQTVCDNCRADAWVDARDDAGDAMHQSRKDRRAEGD